MPIVEGRNYYRQMIESAVAEVFARKVRSTIHPIRSNTTSMQRSLLTALLLAATVTSAVALDRLTPQEVAALPQSVIAADKVVMGVSIKGPSSRIGLVARLAAIDQDRADAEIDQVTGPERRLPLLAYVGLDVRAHP